MTPFMRMPVQWWMPVYGPGPVQLLYKRCTSDLVLLMPVGGGLIDMRSS
jgi:hypothetical protein